jgi:hypothetical protein
MNFKIAILRIPKLSAKCRSQNGNWKCFGVKDNFRIVLIFIFEVHFIPSCSLSCFNANIKINMIVMRIFWREEKLVRVEQRRNIKIAKIFSPTPTKLIARIQKLSCCSSCKNYLIVFIRQSSWMWWKVQKQLSFWKGK